IGDLISSDSQSKTDSLIAVLLHTALANLRAVDQNFQFAASDSPISNSKQQLPSFDFERTSMPTSVAPGKTRLGWIGTGVMGRSMCGHLIDRGFSITVTSRTKSKADSLLAKNAKWADSPKAVAEQSDVVFTIVGFPADVREVLLGEHGALAGSKPGTILVDMTTSDPSLAVEIATA